MSSCLILPLPVADPAAAGGAGSFLQKGWGTASLGTGFQLSNWTGGVLALLFAAKARNASPMTGVCSVRGAGA